MPLIGYHASHEQFSPGELLRYVQLAERAGFQGGMSSEHWAPWSLRQGESGFAWAWLGAAMHATSLPFGMVTSPVGRYHPAIVAQGAATLASMFPGRFWIALGSGELMNEHITGEPWPAKAERQARLLEAVSVIRRLWSGEMVTHRGRVTVDEARLYTLPPEPPLLVGAAVSAETAEWVAGWADALITVSRAHEELERVVRAFRGGGGAGKPMFLQVQLSFAEADMTAREAAWDQWRNNCLPGEVLTDLRLPEHFDAAGEFIRRGDLDAHIRISADLALHAEWLKGDIALGFSHLYLHNVGRNQERFIEAFGAEVLPSLESLGAGSGRP